MDDDVDDEDSQVPGLSAAEVKNCPWPSNCMLYSAGGATTGNCCVDPDLLALLLLQQLLLLLFLLLLLAWRLFACDVRATCDRTSFLLPGVLASAGSEIMKNLSSVGGSTAVEEMEAWPAPVVAYDEEEEDA